MQNGVIIDEAEITIAINKLQTYAGYVITCIAKCEKVLYDIQHFGIIKDDLICAELSNDALIINNCRDRVLEACEVLKEKPDALISEIIDADDFKYPGEMMASVSALLAQFK